MTNQSVMAAIMKKCALATVQKAGFKTSNIKDITHSRKLMLVISKLQLYTLWILHILFKNKTDD